MTTWGGRRRGYEIDTPDGRMTPLRYEIRQAIRKHPALEGKVIAWMLDTTPAYVSKVRVEMGGLNGRLHGEDRAA